ncbi:MAG: response regulator [Clostridia bacterium]|nr:response regulator [Clostridia bacterium]
MTRILIVDDEKTIADGLALMLRRPFPDAQVAPFYDADSALSFARRERPAVILTDIRMPGKDGLQMLQEMKTVCPNAGCVILTGFADFAYAKRAIALGVRQYLLKPVDQAELISCVAALIREKSAAPALPEDGMLLRMAVESPGLSGRDTRGVLRAMGFDTAFSRGMCALLMASGHADALQQALEERGYSPLRYAQDQSLLLLRLAPGERAEDGMRRLELLRADLEYRLGEPVCAGVSLEHASSQLQEAIREAKCALQYRLIRGGGLIAYADLPTLASDALPLTDAETARLERAVESLDEAALRETVGDIFRRLQGDGALNPETLSHLAMNLLLLGVRKSPYMTFRISEVIGSDLYALRELQAFSSLSDLADWLCARIEQMHARILRPDQGGGDVIESAKKYILHNLQKNITLQAIAEQFYINPTYFSELFKKRTGENYQAYLTRLRIDRAKKLLESTSLTIQGVCEQVGYTNCDHFNRLFERETGLRPREYRERFFQGRTGEVPKIQGETPEKAMFSRRPFRDYNESVKKT